MLIRKSGCGEAHSGGGRFCTGFCFPAHKGPHQDVGMGQSPALPGKRSDESVGFGKHADEAQRPMIT
jgi:hypothetical protein